MMKKTKTLKKLSLRKLTISKLTNFNIILGGSGDCDPVSEEYPPVCPPPQSHGIPNCKTHPSEQTDQC